MTDDAHYKALALIGFGIAQTLLATLRAKGVLSDQDAAGLLEGVLVGLENTQDPTDPAVQRARELVETIAHVTQAMRQQRRG